MAKGICKVILIGNLGADPEVRYMPNGNAVANLSLATSETWKDKQTGQRQEKTEWHRVTLYNRQAEVAGEYLKKGSKIYIEGRLQTRKWQDNAGIERYTTEIIANDMQFLDSRPSGESTGNYAQQTGQQQAPPQQAARPNGNNAQQANQHQQQYQQAAPQQQRQAQAPQVHQQQSAPPANNQFSGGPEDFDDDIPF